MDTLTHAISGALVAQATGGRTRSGGISPRLSTKARLLAGTAAAAFPDLDIVARIFGNLTYLNHHRGITHSLIMIPIWAWLLALAFMYLSKQRYHWKDFYAVTALGILVHILGDVITSFGTMILAPVSMQKFALPTTFIIDFYFTGIILVSLLLAWMYKSHARLITRVGSLTLVTYIGFQAVMHYQARDLAWQYASTQNMSSASVHVLPQPLSPFNWKLLIENGNAYHEAYVNLIRSESIHASDDAGFFVRVNAQYQPADRLHWGTKTRFGEATEQQIVMAAWRGILPDIKNFMQFPGLVRIQQEKKETCVWFIDQRFVMEGLRAPFLFGACKPGSSEQWLNFRLAGKERIPLP